MESGGADLAAPSSMVDPCDDVGDMWERDARLPPNSASGARSRLVRAYRVFYYILFRVTHTLVWHVGYDRPIERPEGLPEGGIRAFPRSGQSKHPSLRNFVPIGRIDCRVHSLLVFHSSKVRALTTTVFAQINRESAVERPSLAHGLTASASRLR